MAKQNTLISVNMVGWRCGSSMIVGLLEKMGANLGKYHTVKMPSNPFGAFENDFIMAWQRIHSDNHWMPFGSIKSIEEMAKIGTEHTRCFDLFFKSLFNGPGVVACKCMMGMMIPFYKDSAYVDGKVVWISRDLNNQGMSMCASTGQNRVQTIEWLRKSTEWMEQYLAEVHPTYLRLNYEETLKDPISNAKKISEYTGLSYPGDDVVSAWVHPEFSQFSR